MPDPAPDIRCKTYIAVTPDEVYKTLTTAEGWDAWFTQGAEVDPRPGGSIRFRWVDHGPDRVTCEDSGPVLAAVPDRKFAFQWSPYADPTTVTFELEPRDIGTVVTLTETGYTTSPEALRAMVDCATGWGEALTLLKFYLEYGLTYGEVPEQHITPPPSPPTRRLTSPG